MPSYLSIPKPCEQAWDDMTTEETGRLCNSCNKTVIDFTNLSDEEVLATIRKSTTKICGRFHASQLDRLLYPQKRHQNMLLPMVMISSALVAGVSPMATAQPEKTFTPPVPVTEMANAALIPQPAGIRADTLLVVSGKVLDNDCRPLPAATIRIKNTRYATITDANGNFHLNIPDYFAVKDIVLEFASVGFERRELMLSHVADLQTMKIEMELNQQVLGELNVVVIRKPTLWQKIKRLFK